MEQDATEVNEQKVRRDALRELLRAKCEKIVAAVEALPEPKTFLEAERAARAVMLADKMVERVFSEPKAAKQDSRARTGMPQTSENSSKKAPSVTPRFACAPPPPASQGRIKSAAPTAGSKGEDDMDETPLSKTYLKLEQIVAKITALDAEFNGQKSTQKSTQQGP